MTFVLQETVQSRYTDRNGVEVVVADDVRRLVAAELDRATVPLRPLAAADLPAVRGSRSRRRRWGCHLQLSALVDRDTWGIGDLGSLRRLGEHLAGHGADFVAIGPTNWESYAPGGRLDPSPYGPVSRFLHSTLYAEVTAVDGWGRLPAADRDELREQGRALNAASAAGVDRVAVLELKTRALRRIFAAADGPPDADPDPLDLALAEHLTRYLARRGVLDRYTGDLPAGRQVDFVRWTQSVLRDQLTGVQRAVTAAGMDVGVLADLPVGAAQDGIDRDVFAGCYTAGLSIGTPPDQYVPEGQDWELAFPVPHGPGERHCAQPAALRHLLGPVGGIRVDHVMGLHRLWARAPAAQGAGTYVHYDVGGHLEQLAAATRAGKVIVGEDLGVVPDGLRDGLHAAGVHGTDVVWWRRGSDGSLVTGLTAEGREQAMLVTSFHDTSSLARMVRGDDLRLLQRLGRLGGSPADAARQRAADLAELGVRPGSTPRDAVHTVYWTAFAARADLVSVYYPDFLALECTENVPGTAAADHPNWLTAYGDPAATVAEQLTGPTARQLLAMRR